MKIPKDKQGHMFVGAILSLVLGLWTPVAVLVGVSTFAFGKEIYDSYHPKKHSVEAMDIVATFIGGIIGYLPYTVFGV